LNPDFFTFGDVTFSAWRVALILAVVVCFAIGTWETRSQWPRGMGLWHVWRVALFFTAGGLIGARVLYVLLNWDAFLEFPYLLILPQLGAMSFHGGMAGAILFLYIWCRLNEINILYAIDLIAPYWALGYAIVRAFGCFMIGCCYGKVTDVSWAVTMVRVDDLPRHPVQLYAAGGAVIGMLIILYIREFSRFQGVATFSTIGLYGILRFVVEFFREEPVFWRGLTLAQIPSILMVVAAGLIIVWLYYGKKEKVDFNVCLFNGVQEEKGLVEEDSNISLVKETSKEDKRSQKQKRLSRKKRKKKRRKAVGGKKK